MTLPLGHYLGVSIQTEIIFMSLCGMLLSPFDESLTDLNTNLQVIWGTDFPAKYFTPFSAHVILSIVSGVVVIRSFTLHLYMAFYVVMLWPAIFGEKPSYLIPWIIVGGIKNLLMGLLCLITGIAVCVMSKSYNRIMAEFIFSHILKLSLSLYMWMTVLKYYKFLKKPVMTESQQLCETDSKLLFEMAVRRHLVRSMASEENIRQLLLKCEQKDVDSDDISAWSNTYKGMSALNIDSMFSTNSKEITRTRSLDDYHKPTRRLCVSELSEAVGSYDLVFKSNMTPAEKAKKVLHLTDSDVEKAKKSYVINHPDQWKDEEYHPPDLCAQIASKIRIEAEKYKIAFSTTSEVEIETIDLSIGSSNETSSKDVIKEEENRNKTEEAKTQLKEVKVERKPLDSISKEKLVEKTNKLKVGKTNNYGESEKVSSEKRIFPPKVKNSYKFIPPECINCGGVKSQTLINSNNLPEFVVLSLKNKTAKEPVLVDAACQASTIRIKYLNSNNTPDEKPKKRFTTNPPVTSRTSEAGAALQNTSEGMNSLLKKHTVSLNNAKELQKYLNEFESLNSNNTTM